MSSVCMCVALLDIELLPPPLDRSIIMITVNMRRYPIIHSYTEAILKFELFVVEAHRVRVRVVCVYVCVRVSHKLTFRENIICV